MFQFAGLDTSFELSTCALKALAYHQDLQQQVYSEIAQLKPGFTLDELNSLPILEAFVSECLRMFGPA